MSISGQWGLDLILEYEYVSAKIPSVIGIFPTLLRGKRLILVTGIVTAGIAFGISRTLPLVYTSEGSLIVDSRVISASDGQSNSAVVNDILTEVDVLQSVGLIRRSIEDYDLTNMPSLIPTMRLPAPVADLANVTRQALIDLWPGVDQAATSNGKVDKLVTFIQNNLKVSAWTGGKKLTGSEKNSSVISISFTAGSPDAAAAMVNALVSTYLARVHQTRDEQIALLNKWIAEQTKRHQSSTLMSEQKLTQFAQNHNMVEVQGSLIPALQLNRDQEQLVVLKQELARQQAALDTVGKGASAVPGAQEAQDSKTIQSLRDFEARIYGQISLLTPNDTRRGPLQAELTGIRSMIAEQNSLIVASLRRTVQVTEAREKALEAAIQEETVKAQDASVLNTTFKQLATDLDVRRQIYMTFLIQADRSRFAAEQDSAAHLLFAGTPPLRPDRSGGALALAFGFLAGCFGASGLLIGRAYFNTVINSAEQMELATGLPVFGTLPDFDRVRDDTMAHSMVTETFRAMWVAMHSAKEDQGGTAIIVTSSDAEEGKTTIALTLANRFAADGYRVLLIDGDLRRPQLANLLKLPSDCSLESVMANSVPLEQAIVPLSNGLHCLLSSGRAPNPVKILSSERFAQLILSCRRRYDFVILDSPPAMRVTDPVLMAKVVQHIVFIAQAGRTPYVLAGAAAKRFPAEDRAKMLTLLTRARDPDMGFGYSGYGHQG